MRIHVFTGGYEARTCVSETDTGCVVGFAKVEQNPHNSTLIIVTLHQQTHAGTCKLCGNEVMRVYTCRGSMSPKAVYEGSCKNIFMLI